MWNIPVSKAGLALLEVFKVFQCESIYCLGEKKAVVVPDSEMPAESSVQYPSGRSNFLHNRLWTLHRYQAFVLTPPQHL